MSDNSDHRFHRPRNRPNDVYTDMLFSILLSRSLDVLGYNHDMVKLRVDYWKLRDILSNIHMSHNIILCKLEKMSAGSQPEGVVAHFGSDKDLMVVDNTVICACNPLPFIHRRNISIFLTDNCHTEPGYTKLKLIKLGNFVNSLLIYTSLFPLGNREFYLSSELFTNMMLQQIRIRYNNTSLSKSGPAIPVLTTLYTPGIVHDMVVCFKCYCPALLSAWLKRQRRYNWPPRNILHEIAQMEAHVVPVGCKGSATYSQEWRICFTKAEIHLIHNLNNTQIKVYIILKMISKTTLKIICPEITSYIVKNIVLWMCESLPVDHFTDHQLVKMIFHALGILRNCVVQNYLPSYMIPERNLFYRTIEQKHKLIKSLSSFIEEGPSALFHTLDKIGGAMSLLYQEPARAEFYRIKRNIIEKLNFCGTIRSDLAQTQDMSGDEISQFLFQHDELYVNIGNALRNLILPGWSEIPNAEDILLQRMTEFLS